jgi:acylphosphatase
MVVEANRALQILVKGRVQGVGFRAWLHHQAELRGLSGWVRNRRDGAVEAVIFGPKEAVDAMLAVCREGPATARVAAVEIVSQDPERPDRGFEVRPTA